MKKVILIVLILCSGGVFGGCISTLTPEAKVSMNEFDKAIQELTAEGIKISEQVQRLVAEFKRVEAAVKAGKMSPADYLGVIAKLQPELDKAIAHYGVVESRIKTVFEKQSQLRKDHKVPWWQVLLTSGLAVTTALAGGGVLKMNGLAKAALGAARLVVKNVELGGDHKEIKARIKSANHAPTNKIVGEMYGH